MRHNEKHQPSAGKHDASSVRRYVEFVDGQYLWESNSILNYFAEGTKFLPQAKYDRAKVVQWQFFEQHSHEPYIAIAGYINKYLGLPKARAAEYHSKQAGGHKALAVMDQHHEPRECI
jgi:glutathione S-transferase